MKQKITKTERRRHAAASSIGGKRAAQRMTKRERVERARRAALVRHHGRASAMRTKLRIYRGKDRVGILFTRSCRLRTQDSALRAMHAEARTKGMFSLGDVNAPQPPAGLIVDHACYTKLQPSDPNSVWQFRDQLLRAGFVVDEL